MEIKFSEREYNFVKDVFAKANLTPEIFGMTDANKSMLLDDNKVIAWLSNQSVYKKIEGIRPRSIKSDFANRVVMDKIKELKLPVGLFIRH